MMMHLLLVKRFILRDGHVPCRNRRALRVSVFRRSEHGDCQPQSPKSMAQYCYILLKAVICLLVTFQRPATSFFLLHSSQRKVVSSLKVVNSIPNKVNNKNSLLTEVTQSKRSLNEDHYFYLLKHKRRLQRLYLKSKIPIFIFVLSISSSPLSSSAASDFELLNGNVRLPETTTLQLGDKRKGIVQLSNPQLVGAGSGGAVFSFDSTDLLLKVSWERTSKAIQRECKTLQLLEQEGIDCAERCLGSFDYNDDRQRTMILVSPYVRDAVASLSNVSNQQAKEEATRQIVRTLVQMLKANIVTIDVQPLISKATGKTIFVDMTEAQVLSSKEKTFLEQTLVTSFVSEMVALIPEDYWEIACQAVAEELSEIARLDGSTMESSVRRILEETPFL